jgi:hypothetical protein
MVINIAIGYPIVSPPKSGAITPQRSMTNRELKKKPGIAASMLKYPIV